MRMIYCSVLFLAACNNSNSEKSKKDRLSFYYGRVVYFDTLAKIKTQYYHILLQGQAMSDSFEVKTPDQYAKEAKEEQEIDSEIKRYTDSITYYKQRIKELE